MPDCWKQNILCSNVNSDQPWKSVRVRHPGAFVTRYLDKLFTSSSSVGKSDSITIPRSVMCWVSTTGKSRCLRAPWAHIPNFPLCQKWYEKRLHHVTCHSFFFLLSPCPFPTPACEIPSRSWHTSQRLCWSSLKRENTDLGWSGLHCLKIWHYLIQVVQEICDKQSINKIRSPYKSNSFL